MKPNHAPDARHVGALRIVLQRGYFLIFLKYYLIEWPRTSRPDLTISQPIRPWTPISAPMPTMAARYLGKMRPLAQKYAAGITNARPTVRPRMLRRHQKHSIHTADEPGWIATGTAPHRCEYSMSQMFWKCSIVIFELYLNSGNCL